MSHTHTCQHCQAPVECDGALEPNYDGWPEQVCTVYHVQGRHVLCDPCILASRERCDVCGEPASVVVEDSDDASGYRGDVALCERHLATGVKSA